MTKIAYEKAKHLYHKIERIDAFINIIEKELQKQKEGEEENLTQCEFRYYDTETYRTAITDKVDVLFSYEELEIIKRAFEEEKHKLNCNIAIL